eukprot:Awhi_evm1s14573
MKIFKCKTMRKERSLVENYYEKPIYTGLLQSAPSTKLKIQLPISHKDEYQNYNNGGRSDNNNDSSNVQIIARPISPSPSRTPSLNHVDNVELEASRPRSRGVSSPRISLSNDSMTPSPSLNSSIASFGSCNNPKKQHVDYDDGNNGSSIRTMCTTRPPFPSPSSAPSFEIVDENEASRVCSRRVSASPRIGSYHNSMTSPSSNPSSYSSHKERNSFTESIYHDPQVVYDDCNDGAAIVRPPSSSPSRSPSYQTIATNEAPRFCSRRVSASPRIGSNNNSMIPSPSPTPPRSSFSGTSIVDRARPPTPSPSRSPSFKVVDGYHRTHSKRGASVSPRATLNNNSITSTPTPISPRASFINDSGTYNPTPNSPRTSFNGHNNNDSDNSCPFSSSSDLSIRSFESYNSVNVGTVSSRSSDGPRLRISPSSSRTSMSYARYPVPLPPRPISPSACLSNNSIMSFADDTTIRSTPYRAITMARPMSPSPSIPQQYLK